MLSLTRKRGLRTPTLHALRLLDEDFRNPFPRTLASLSNEGIHPAENVSFMERAFHEDRCTLETVFALKWKRIRLDSITRNTSMIETLKATLNERWNTRTWPSILTTLARKSIKRRG